MPEKPKKSLREVYRNIGPALTLTPEDFGFILDPETGALIPEDSLDEGSNSHHEPEPV